MKRILTVLTLLFAVCMALVCNAASASEQDPHWTATGVRDTSIQTVRYGPGTNILATATLAGVPSYTPKVAGSSCTPYGANYHYYGTVPDLPGRGVIVFYIQLCL